MPDRVPPAESKASLQASRANERARVATTVVARALRTITDSWISTTLRDSRKMNLKLVPGSHQRFPKARAREQMRMAMMMMISFEEEVNKY